MTFLNTEEVLGLTFRLILVRINIGVLQLSHECLFIVVFKVKQRSRLLDDFSDDWVISRFTIKALIIILVELQSEISHVDIEGNRRDNAEWLRLVDFGRNDERFRLLTVRSVSNLFEILRVSKVVKVVD